MTQEEIFDADFMNTPVSYAGKLWLIGSTYDDDTADLVRENGERANAPFMQLKQVKEGEINDFC